MSSRSHEASFSGQPVGSEALLRLEADAELGPEQREALDRLRASDPQADDRIRTERALRESVARVMGSDVAPAALRERVRAAFATDEGASAAAEPISFSERAPQVARSWQRPWWLGVAAGFVLAAGLLSLLSPWSQPPGIGPGSGATAEGPYSTTRLVSFVEKRHASCANLGAELERELPYVDRADAERAAIEILDKVPDVFDLADGSLAEMGYEFSGLGPCRIPGEGASAHLLYTSPDPGNPPISLWIQRDTGEWSDRVKQPGKCYDVMLSKKRGSSLSLWRRNGLVFFLYAPQGNLETPARSAFRAPDDGDTI